MFSTCQEHRQGHHVFCLSHVLAHWLYIHHQTKLAYFNFLFLAKKFTSHWAGNQAGAVCGLLSKRLPKEAIWLLTFWLTAVRQCQLCQSFILETSQIREQNKRNLLLKSDFQAAAGLISTWESSTSLLLCWCYSSHLCRNVKRQGNQKRALIYRATSIKG